MKCHTISESSWHALLKFIRFKPDLIALWAPEASEGQKSENQLPPRDLEYLKKRPFFGSFFCLERSVMTRRSRTYPALPVMHPIWGIKRTIFKNFGFLVFCSLDFSSSLPIVHFWHPVWPLTSKRN